MIQWLRDRVQDPDRTVLHRALRVAVVMPPLFAFGLHGVGDPQFALLAAFGSFATLAMADFTGPSRSRLAAHAGLCVVGTVLVILGTVLSTTLWPAVIAMLAVGAACQFAAVLGGQVALGSNAAILAFVVSVMVPAGTGAIVPRAGGWIAAVALAALAAAFLWPRHERRDLYERLADACRALAAIARDRRRGRRGGDEPRGRTARGRSRARGATGAGLPAARPAEPSAGAARTGRRARTRAGPLRARSRPRPR